MDGITEWIVETFGAAIPAEWIIFAVSLLPLLELRTEKASLEDVFLELTGGEGQPEVVPASPAKENEEPAEAPKQEEKAGEEP